MIKSSVVTVTFRQKTAEEVVEICKKAKIDAVEWSSSVHLAKGDTQKAQYIKDMCKNSKIEICAYSSYYYLGEYEDCVSEFQQYLDVACVLQTKIIRIWAGTKSSDGISQTRLAELYHEANIISQMAREKGICISFEYHTKSLTDTLQSTVNLLENVPLAKTHWQIPNAQSLEQSIIDVTTLKDKITILHVHNCTDKVYEDLSYKSDYFSEIFSLLKEKELFAGVEFVKNSSDEQFLLDAQTLNKLCAETMR